MEPIRREKRDGGGLARLGPLWVSSESVNYGNEISALEWQRRRKDNQRANNGKLRWKKTSLRNQDGGVTSLEETLVAGADG